MSKLNHKLEEKFVGANCVRPHLGEITKKQNGITLIALIITIIVMLILTGVTLSITLGDNGLVNKAKEAKTQTQVAMDRELLLSAVVGAIGEDGKVNLSAIVLPEGFTGSNGTYTSKNGNAFTVSENGEIEYTGSETGSTDSEEETETVDLNGKYYYYQDDITSYYEMKNNNTLTFVLQGIEQGAFPINVDYNNQTITLTPEYKDEEAGEVVTDTINYYIIMENNEIVNKILYLTNGEDFSIFFQNNNGYEHNIDGIYMNETGNRRYTFNSANGTVIEEYYQNDIWTNNSGKNCEYGSFNEIYFFMESQSAYISFNVSEDKNTITIYGETYTKQSN